jgi:hypothetical protein
LEESYKTHKCNVWEKCSVYIVRRGGTFVSHWGLKGSETPQIKWRLFDRKIVGQNGESTENYL